jgi:uncharacterized protein YbjT (DUF2867 family)
MIVVSGASGMFGGAIAAELAARGVPARGLVRREDAAAQLRERGIEPVMGDMDAPETLDGALAGADTLFVVSPMDEHVAVREGHLLAAAQRAGVARILKLHGAVEHHDALGELHQQSIAAIRDSGLDWALLSPNSVMETTLFSQADAIRYTDGMYGSSGEGAAAVVALEDVARAGATLLADGSQTGRDYQLTGPRAVSLYDIAAALTQVLGRTITYNDMPDDAFKDVLVQQAGMSPEQAEVGVLVHMRAWRAGGAAHVTDTVRELTGRDPVDVVDWIAAHRERFASPS